MTRILKIFLITVISVFVGTPATLASDHNGDEAINPKELIFEHLGDGYGWEAPFQHHIRIPLPVIVKASDGFHIFRSSKVARVGEHP